MVVFDKFHEAPPFVVYATLKLEVDILEEEPTAIPYNGFVRAYLVLLIWNDGSLTTVISPLLICTGPLISTAKLSTFGEYVLNPMVEWFFNELLPATII